MTGLLSLFIGSLLASTLLPWGVEVPLYLMLESGRYSPGVLIVVATVGNTLGGVITFWIGGLLRRGLEQTRFNRKLQDWFQNQESALVRVKKWGVPALLLSWMPVIGDPLCLAAGYLKLPFWPSAIMILLGKLFRYVALLSLFVQA